MEILGIFLGILCFSGFSFIVNKSQIDKCNIFSFTASLYFVGFLLCLVTVVSNNCIRAFPSAVLSLSVVAGIASVGSFLSQLAALKTGGKLSVINIIGNLSTLIPIIYSIVVFHEKITVTKYIGIFLFIVFIFMLNFAGKEEAL